MDARAGDVDDLIAVARMLEEEDGGCALGIDGRQIDAQEALLDTTRRMPLKHPPPPPKHAEATRRRRELLLRRRRRRGRCC